MIIIDCTTCKWGGKCKHHGRLLVGLTRVVIDFNVCMEEREEFLNVVIEYMSKYILPYCKKYQQKGIDAINSKE